MEHPAWTCLSADLLAKGMGGGWLCPTCGLSFGTEAGGLQQQGEEDSRVARLGGWIGEAVVPQAGGSCAPRLCTCLAGPLLTGDIRNLQTPGAHVFRLPWFHLPATFGEQPHGSAASRGRLLARLGQRRGVKSHQRSPPRTLYHLGLLRKPTLKAATSPSMTGRQCGEFEHYLPG